MYPKYIIKRFNIYYNKEYNMQNLKCLIRRHFPICDIIEDGDVIYLSRKSRLEREIEEKNKEVPILEAIDSSKSFINSAFIDKYYQNMYNKLSETNYEVSCNHKIDFNTIIKSEIDKQKIEIDELFKLINISEYN